MRLRDLDANTHTHTLSLSLPKIQNASPSLPPSHLHASIHVEPKSCNIDKVAKRKKRNFTLVSYIHPGTTFYQWWQPTNQPQRPATASAHDNPHLDIMPLFTLQCILLLLRTPPIVRIGSGTICKVVQV